MIDDDHSWRAPLTYEIENHCTSCMLVDVIKGVKQRSCAHFQEKKQIDREKILVLTSERPSRFVEALNESQMEQMSLH